MKPNPVWAEIVQVATILRDYIADGQSGYVASIQLRAEQQVGFMGGRRPEEDARDVQLPQRLAAGRDGCGNSTPQATSLTTREDIYEHLVAGRLVIVDQSSGDPVLNKASADRIMRRIFEGNQA